MSNPNSPISEANLMAYIYEDVDDADIFGLTSAAHPFNNPSSESKVSLKLPMFTSVFSGLLFTFLI